MLMKRLLILLLVVLPAVCVPAFATTYNVNSSMSAATISSTAATAAGSSGNVVQFAAGTYNLTSTINAPCTNGVIYQGVAIVEPNEANVPAVVLTGPNTTSYSISVPSNGTGNTSFTSGCQFLYLGFSGQHGGIDVQYPASGINFQYNYFTLNDGAASGGSPVANQNIRLEGNCPSSGSGALCGPSLGVSYVQVDSNVFYNQCATIRANYTVDNGAYCTAVFAIGSVTHQTITNNIVDLIEEGFKWNEVYYQITDVSNSVVVENNRMLGNSRILNEDQQSTNGSASFSHNSHYAPNNPNYSTFEDSLPGNAGFQVHDNVYIGNVPITYGGSGAHYGYGVEIWGANVTGTYNLFQGGNTTGSGTCAGYSAAGFFCNGWGVIMGPGNATQSWTNNYFSGADVWNGGSSAAFLYEDGGTPPDPPAGPVISPNTVVQTSTTQPTATPAISPAGGSFSGPLTVTLSDSDSANRNISMFYTTDGSTPAPFAIGNTAGTSQLYTGPLTITATTTVKAIAQWGQGANQGIVFPSFGWVPSSVTSQTFTASGGSSPASTPTFSPGAGTYTGTQSVTISSSSSGAVICYNTTGSPATNGSTGCTTGTLYSGPVAVAASETLFAVAGGTGYTDSSVGSAAYVINTQAATPTFSPGAGTYTGTQTVTLANSSSGAVICYTTNGTTPSTNGSTGCTTGTHYSSPISVAASQTVKAIAGGTGYTDSSVGSAAYVINTQAATPTFSPGAGTYTGTQTVTIATTSGTVICYNTTGSPATNGSTGCTTGTLYSGPVTVSSSETLFAVAGGTGFTDSSVGSAVYTLGNVINAASCSSTNVQTAFNAVTASTTTVNIPAGTCAWTTQVTLTVPSGSTTLSILGAGSLTTTGGGDVTVIQDEVANSNPIVVITPTTSTAKLRIAGLTFEGGTLASGNDKYNGIVSVQGNSANTRVDHDHFDTITYSTAETSSSVQFVGCVYGVVDHNIFDNPSGSENNSVRVYNQGSCYSDTLGVGDQAWAHPDNFGSANFLYAENNVFNSGASNDCTDGGSFVMRFNTFNMTSPPPTTQTHPTGGGGRIRGCRAEEVYLNQMNANASNYIGTDVWVSSGAALIWGNTIPSSSVGGGTGYANFINLLDMRVNNSTYAQTATPNGWGYCGTAFNGTGSNWDGNTPSAANGYPCLDQPGRGQGDLLTGGFSSDGSGSNNVTNSATGGTASSPSAYPRQALDPIYEWMDAYSPVPSNPSRLLDITEGTFTNNVDYYLWCNASSQSGCTSFTGATGVGSGVLASRPSTCTTGVGYWATDQGSWNSSGSGGQGELFKCTATNTWTIAYTPYTYPHPLVSSSVIAPSISITGSVVVTGNVGITQ